MLRELIRKDLILNRAALVWTAAVYLAYPFWMSTESHVPLREFLVLIALLSSILPVTILAREDKFRAAVLTRSLPVSSSAIVRARYLLTWLLGAVGLAIAFLTLTLWPWSHFDLSEVWRPRTVLFAASLVMLIAAVLQPFVCRFGLVGVGVFLVALQVLGLAAFAMAELTGFRGAVKSAFSVMGRLLDLLQGGLGAPLTATAIVGMLVAATAVSVRFSVWLSERRDL